MAKKKRNNIVQMPQGSKGKQLAESAMGLQMLRTMPVTAIFQSIELQIKVLKERGVEIRDWEDKERILEQIRFIGGKAYFLAAKEDEPEE